MAPQCQVLEESEFRTNERCFFAVSKGLTCSLLQLQNCCYEDAANLLLSDLNLLLLNHMQRFKVFKNEHPCYVIRTLQLHSEEIRLLTDCAMSSTSSIFGKAFTPEIQQIALQAFTYSIPWILTIQSRPIIRRGLHSCLDKKITDLKTQESPLIRSDGTFNITEANTVAMIVQQKKIENNILFVGLLKSMKLNPCIDAEDPLEVSEDLRKIWSANVYLLERCKAIDAEIIGKNRLLENQVYEMLCLRQIFTEMQLHIAGKLPCLVLLQRELNPYIDLEFLKRYMAIRVESEELEEIIKELAIRTKKARQHEQLEEKDEEEKEISPSTSAKLSSKEDQEDLNDLIKYMQAANINLQWLAEKLQKELLMLNERIIQTNKEINILQELFRRNLNAELTALQNDAHVFLDKTSAGKYSFSLRRLISIIAPGQKILPVSPSSTGSALTPLSFPILSKEPSTKIFLKIVLSEISWIDKCYSDDINILSVTEILRFQLERALQTIEEDNIRKIEASGTAIPQNEKDIMLQAGTTTDSKILSLQSRIFKGLLGIISGNIDKMKEGKTAKARHKEEASRALAYSLPIVFDFCLNPENIKPFDHQPAELQNLLTRKQPEGEADNLLKRIEKERITLKQLHENIDQRQKDSFIANTKASTSKKTFPTTDLEKTWTYRNKLLAHRRDLATQIHIANAKIKHTKLEIRIQQGLFTDSNMPLTILGTILQVVHGKALNTHELIDFNKHRTLDSIRLTKTEKMTEAKILKIILADVINEREKLSEIQQQVAQEIEQRTIDEQIVCNKWAIEVLERDIPFLEEQFKELTLTQEKLDRELSFLSTFTDIRISGLITDLFKPQLSH